MSEAQKYEIVFPLPLAVREVWPSEPADFTPWLSENLGVLDLLGLGELTCEGTEVSIPQTGRALDILATTPTGEKVAIENQFSKADHDHLTRGLAYAVGLGCSALVIVAEGFGGEFRAVADYLNSLVESSNAELRISVFLVELSVETIGRSAIPRFSIVSRPNAWLEQVSKAAPELLSSVDAFLDRVAPGRKEQFGPVIEFWKELPGSQIRFSTQSLSLDLPRPDKPSRPLSHFLLWLDGTYTVQRGYLVEAGLVPKDSAEFDQLLRELFPYLAWKEKQYFLNSTRDATISVEQVRRFLSLLNEA